MCLLQITSTHNPLSETHKHWDVEIVQCGLEIIFNKLSSRGGGTTYMERLRLKGVLFFQASVIKKVEIL